MALYDDQIRLAALCTCLNGEPWITDTHTPEGAVRVSSLTVALAGGFTFFVGYQNCYERRVHSHIR